MVDENHTWNGQIHILENKISKNIGLLYRAKVCHCILTMTTLHFSFFQSYLNYGNIAWACSTKSNLCKIASQLKHAVNAIPKNNHQEITDARKFMEENGILNVYKFNLYQVLNFLFRVQNETIPKSFQTKFQYTEHK